MRPTAVAIGMFDGVHRGHRFLLDRLKAEAERRGFEPAVVTFDRHPKSVIRPDEMPRLLTTVSERVALLTEAGIHNIEVVPFDGDLRRLTAAEFARRVLLEQLEARYLLLGYNNGFGADRLGAVEAYREALAPLGIEVDVCQPLDRLSVSSSAIRRAIADGDMVSAAQMLGRSYDITGTVVKGRQLGRTIGFPTANLRVAGDKLLPRPGVYAAECFGAPAMLNIGTAPTVSDGGTMTVEVHIIATSPADASTPLDLYGKTVAVTVLKRLRDEQRFADLDRLRAALEADRLDALAVWAHRAPTV